MGRSASKILVLTCDSEAGACYLGLRQSAVVDTLEFDTGSISFYVNLDIDADGHLAGIEFIGLENEGPERFLGLIASGYIADLVAAAGFETGKLRNGPEVRVHFST